MKRKLIIIFLLLCLVACSNKEVKIDSSPTEIVMGTEDEKVSCIIESTMIICTRTLNVDGIGDIKSTLKMRIKEDEKIKAIKTVPYSAYMDLTEEVESKKSSLSSEGYCNNKSDDVLTVSVVTTFVKNELDYTIEEIYHFSNNQLTEDSFMPMAISTERHRSDEEIYEEKQKKREKLQQRANDQFEQLYNEYSKDYTHHKAEEYLNIPLFNEHKDFLAIKYEYCDDGQKVLEAFAGLKSCKIFNENATNETYDLSNFQLEDIKLTYYPYTYIIEEDIEEVGSEILMQRLSKNEWIMIPRYYAINEWYTLDKDGNELQTPSSDQTYCYAFNENINRCYRFTTFEEWDEVYLTISDSYTIKENDETAYAYKTLVFAIMKE